MGKDVKKEFKRGVQWLVWSGVLAVASVSGWLVYGQFVNRPPEPIPVRVVKVKQDTVENSINESGTVELGSQQKLKSPAEGTIEEVRVRVGDRVESGQELIVLRNPERQTILTKNELDVQQKKLALTNNLQKVAAAEEKVKIAEKALQNLIDQSNAEKRTKLDELQVKIQQKELALANDRQKIVTAEENLAAAQRKLQTDKTLYDRGFIPENELQTQKEEVRSAIAALQDAELQVKTTTLDLQQFQIERQKIEQEFQDKLQENETKVREAKAAVQLAQSELQESEVLARTTTLELQQLQLDRQKIEQQLKDNIITAPIEGKVLDIKIKAGDGVKVTDELLTLGDPSQELVQLQLSTLNAARVVSNQETRITVIGLDEKTFQGRVKNLSPLAQSGSAGSEDSSNQSGGAMVPATVQLDTPSGTLIPGSQVNVEIILDRRQNVMVLNTDAIQRDGPKHFVWVRDPEGKAQKKPVTLGLEGLTSVEVTAGLRPGDEVVLPPPDPPLEPGMPVISQDSPDAAGGEKGKGKKKRGK